MIYFLKNHTNNTVKIGRSKDLSERLRTLQTGNSSRLDFIYVIEDVDDSFETFVHEVCQLYHISGEWFKGEVIENHLLKHPWYLEHMKPYSQWVKEKADALQSSNASTSLAS